ncbi:MAG TPA: lysophospholipid acyltransferase family protein [Luteolibacter sp.]|nr:lysophospholipid acyltransferase family protein [Luteolibacter sp.]
MKANSRWAARLGMFGDLPARLAAHSLRVLPWFLEPVLTTGWTLLFFLLARGQRRAVRDNLRAMFPDWGAARATCGAWRVFRNFASTYVDGLRCETETGGVDWEVDGVAHMEELTERTDGCILLTAHMGSYDIAAPLFASRLKRPLHTVRAPEREPEAQRLRENEIRHKAQRHPNFHTLWNRGDNLLGMELARLLHAGDIVAVQADRVIFDVSPMEVEVEPGLRMRLPRGPLVLARVTGAACYPVFITRTGWRRYRVHFQPPLELPPRARDGDGAAAALWAGTVYRAVREHWSQWFVFEPVLARVK